MKKNYLTYPCKVMNITQGYEGSYSHANHVNGSPMDYPIDEACADTGRDYFCCPCDAVQIAHIYGVGTGGTNTIWIESTEKVITPSGEDYVTILVTHPNDDDLKKLSVGQRFTRGQQMFREGTDGNATGNHLHIAVGFGRFTGAGWVKNTAGAWVHKSTGAQIKPENAFFIDTDFTTVKSSKGLVFAEIPKESAVIPGDIDGDGEVTAADARVALRAATGLEELTAEQKAAADYNGDGEITPADARDIIRNAVGLDENSDTESENTNEVDTVKNIIDVSTFQGDINWAKVKGNCDGAIIRTGFRGYGSKGTLSTDARFKKNIAEATAQGIPIGVYFFTQALNEAEAKAEAQYVLDLIKGYKITYPVYIDIEYSNAKANGRADKLSKAVRTSNAIAFLETIKAAGYIPGVYASKHWFENMLDDSRLSAYTHWVAHYASKCGYGGKYDMWQYTDSGSVPGISGNVDKNYCYRNFASGSSSAATSKPSTSKPSAPASTGSTGTYTVKSGDTLSGIAAAKNTTVSALVALNGISDPDKIYVGQVLKIPSSGTKYTTYTVQSGDSLSKIAARYNTTVSTLAALNGISNPDVIYVGQTIKIPQ